MPTRRIALTLLTSSLLLGGCVTDGLPPVAGQFIQAATLTDSDVVQMSAKGIEALDAKNFVALPENAYSKRLAELTRYYTSANGRPLLFKVYLTPEVNAFATPDGSVRVFSGLMDKMTDDELKFVIGHEIGHVARSHAKKKLQVAYVASGIRQTVAAQEGAAGQLMAGQLGDLLETVVNAQFSQAEETEADEYGLDIAIKANASPNAAVIALLKLSDGNSKNITAKWLGSHPDSLDRAEHLRDIAMHRANIMSPVGSSEEPISHPSIETPAQDKSMPTSGAQTPRNDDRYLKNNRAAPERVKDLHSVGGSPQSVPFYAGPSNAHVHLASYKNVRGTSDKNVRWAALVSDQLATQPWFAGRTVSTYEINLGAKGQWTRVVAGDFTSLADAKTFCQTVLIHWPYCVAVNGVRPATTSTKAAGLDSAEPPLSAASGTRNERLSSKKVKPIQDPISAEDIEVDRILSKHSRLLDLQAKHCAAICKIDDSKDGCIICSEGLGSSSISEDELKKMGAYFDVDAGNFAKGIWVDGVGEGSFLMIGEKYALGLIDADGQKLNIYRITMDSLSNGVLKIRTGLRANQTSWVITSKSSDIIEISRDGRTETLFRSKHTPLSAWRKMNGNSSQ